MDKGRIVLVLLIIHLVFVFPTEFSTTNSIASTSPQGTSLSSLNLEKEHATFTLLLSSSAEVAKSLSPVAFKEASNMENVAQMLLRKSTAIASYRYSEDKRTSVLADSKALTIHLQPWSSMQEPRSSLVSKSLQTHSNIQRTLDISSIFSQSMQHLQITSASQNSSLNNAVTYTIVPTNTPLSFIHKSESRFLSQHLEPFISTAPTSLTLDVANIILKTEPQNLLKSSLYESRTILEPSIASSQANLKQFSLSNRRTVLPLNRFASVTTSLSLNISNLLFHASTLIQRDRITKTYVNQQATLISESATKFGAKMPSSSTILHTNSLFPYTEPLTSTTPQLISSSTHQSSFHHSGLLPSTSIKTVSFEAVESKENRGSLTTILPARTSSAAISTIKKPNDNVDVEKQDKDKGFPAWIAILSSVGAFIAILTIIAVTLKFIKWNKDHGDYSLWVSNLELQPITSRNAEVLT